jgi:hypothetical protein
MMGGIYSSETYVCLLTTFPSNPEYRIGHIQHRENVKFNIVTT